MAFTKITAAGIGSTETVTLDGLSVINNGSFGGNLTVGGVLTYEDVTNVDSIGLITARNGVVVGSGITLSADGDGFFTGVVTATSYRGDGANLTGINADLVNDTSPQLGGLLDGNGQTANFTANNTGLGLPIGTDANEPSAGSYKGYIRFNDDDDLVYYSNGTAWKKINTELATLSSVSGNIYDGLASTLTLTGNGFMTSSLVVNFAQSSDSIDVNVTVTPTDTTSASVAVPSTVYDSVTAGNAVTIKVTNSDGEVSNTKNVTALALPTGGTITTSGGFRIHTFTSSGTFVNTIADNSVQYVVVAGGGGVGTRRHGGGGGAGGYRSSVTGESSGGASTSAESELSLSAASYTVTIGAGGASITNSNDNTNSGATNGSNSVFGSITSIGGGLGSAYTNAGVDGGSGGGGGAANNTSYYGGSGTSGQGNDGGRGGYNVGGGGGGGGGGASGAGGAATGSDGSQTGGAGGAGIASTITGSSVTRAGGGGGGGDSSGTGGAGGSGGGGTGANASSSPTSGTANTGGGAGGGGPENRTAPSGGSGIVIVRYAI